MLENEPAELSRRAVGDACPGELSFWRFVQGGLTPDEFGLIEAHIDACEHCMAAVAAAARELQRVARSGESVAVSSSPVEARPPGLPQAIGRYRIEGIGQGGMGVVYRATEPGTDRRLGTCRVVDRQK